MIELYATKDVSKVFGLRESRLRYWFQIGFLWPSVRRKGRVFYTFADMVLIKAAKELLDSGIPVERVRKSLTRLREQLPDRLSPISDLRVCSDGNTVVVVDGDGAYEPETGQLVMAFSVSSLSSHVGEIVRGESVDTGSVPRAPSDLYGATEPHEQPTAYQWFVEGRKAHERGDRDEAILCYERAVELEPSMSAALTNLGTLRYDAGDLEGARDAYDEALGYDPTQVEARFNLGNLLEDMGEIELAIAELKEVCRAAPEFADAHYNLGLMLARIGGLTQARDHLRRYLELDPKSEWAVRARGFLQNAETAEA